MQVTLLLASTLWMFFAPPQSNSPLYHGPLRNTFVVATETFIDNATAINVEAENATFDPQMQALKTSKANLANLVADDREREISTATNDVLFMISSCHIQAIDGTKTDACKSQIANSLHHMMVVLNKHKSGGAWVDGPPAQ